MENRTYENDNEAIEAWNTVLFDKFVRFRDTLTRGLARRPREGMAAGSSGRRAKRGRPSQSSRGEGRKPKADPMAKRTPGIPGPSACHEPFGT